MLRGGYFVVLPFTVSTSYQFYDTARSILPYYLAPKGVRKAPCFSLYCFGVKICPSFTGKGEVGQHGPSGDVQAA